MFDWNPRPEPPPGATRVEVLDETLRDGLQSPSAIDPPLPAKIALLHTMRDLGINGVTLGLPGAGPRSVEHCLRLAHEMATHAMPMRAVCAARTKVEDIQPIADIAARTGLAIDVNAFIGCSPIRLWAESWSLGMILRFVETSVQFAHAQNLRVCLVLEDSTRSSPDTLEMIIRHGMEMGVSRLCLCDTVGHSTPTGVVALMTWVDTLRRAERPDMLLEWHGHNDRGLGLANAITALHHGADCIHATALGMGERVGNVSMEQLLVNLQTLRHWPHPLTQLDNYCEQVAATCQAEPRAAHFYRRMAQRGFINPK